MLTIPRLWLALALFASMPWSAAAQDRQDSAPGLRQALATAAPGTTVRLQPGEYWIAVDSSGIGLDIPAGVTLDARGATIRLIETDRPQYAVVNFSGANSGMVGGTIHGDRERHRGKGGEWGMCVRFLGAVNTTVRGTKAFDCWGDGFYVGAQKEGLPSRQVVLQDIEAARNRRNNVSIVAADGFRISGARLRGARGTPPEAGIDLEPNQGGVVRNGELVNIVAEGNARFGLVMAGKRGTIENISIEQLQAVDNEGPGVWLSVVRDVRAVGMRTAGNGREGLVLIRARDLRLGDYVSENNGRADKTNQEVRQ